MYERYRIRVKQLLEKLPKGITVHYTDSGGHDHTVSDVEFLLALANAQRDGKKGLVKSIDPVDLTALEAKSRIYSVMLTVDGYKPAYSVIIRDPETGENRELTEEEEDDLNRKLDAMTESERAAYWRQQERLFLEHFGAKGGKA